MSAMDLSIVNGSVYREGRFERTNVHIKDGVIAAIAGDLPEVESTFDAAGKWVLPGLIDPHVHFNLRVGGTVSRDDFRTGSMLAALGGVTTIIDFLDPADTLAGMRNAFEERKRDAAGCLVDYGFHPTIMGYRDNLRELADFVVSQGMPSIKLFTTYASTNRRTGDRLIAALCKESERAGFTVLVHAENDGLVDESTGAPFSQHGRRRPPLSEISEVVKLAQICEYSGGYCYIVHTNCGTTVAKLKQGFAELLREGRFAIESCPHYFLFDDSRYADRLGYRYVMTPPLRPAGERERLASLFDDVDVIATDHCPYPEEAKDHACLDDIPNGIEGIPYTLPALFPLFGERVIAKMTHESARLHGLYPRKGVLREGSDGDVVIFDPARSYVFDGNMPWHRALGRDGSVSPYDGVRAQGEVVATFVRGRAVMRDGEVLDHQGTFIPRGRR
ncbi:D-phenylhydantoinase [Pseudodesulfovibrio hydrargyri]|uniref:D-phenylhydantoinase n=2 Tax=Pseudodesulfovibrio hydrargyri TaxID=2125990 RepID=A0A1J5NCE6_9BACT|nr:D-phenylhydantoinase [Pseudodesulfovibrio hydrargyri]